MVGKGSSSQEMQSALQSKDERIRNLQMKVAELVEKCKECFASAMTKIRLAQEGEEELRKRARDEGPALYELREAVSCADDSG